MLELIAVISGLGLIFYLPVRARWIGDGWVPTNFTGTPTDFRANYVRQLPRFMWFGIGVGVVFLALIHTPQAGASNSVTRASPLPAIVAPARASY